MLNYLYSYSAANPEGIKENGANAFLVNSEAIGITLVFPSHQQNGYQVRVNQTCGLHVHLSISLDRHWSFGSAVLLHFFTTRGS